MTMMLKLLAGSGGSVGTPQEPWNPASKIGASATGLPQTPLMSAQAARPVGGQVQTGGFGTDTPTMTTLPGQKPQSFGSQLGQALFPQATAGKGGSSG